MPLRLWFSPATVSRLRQRAERPWFRDIAATAAATAASPVPAGREPLLAWIESAALTHVLAGDPSLGQRTGEATLAVLETPERSDLGAAAQTLGAVIAYDLCAQSWPASLRDAVGQRLVVFANRLAGVELSTDNPDNPFNNWWGVTHSAAGLAALCVRGEYTGAESTLSLSRDRVRTFLLNYGDRGHYYEGTGYGCYALSQWAPYVLAERQLGEYDPLALAPGVPWFGATLFAMTVARRQINDRTGEAGERLGMRILWNDDGGTFPAGGIGPLAAALLPESLRPGARRLLDQLHGPEGDRSAVAPGRGLLWNLLYTPADPEPSALAPVPLPRFLHDQRSGLVLFRNRYHDADDCVVGIYAKTYHGGGHTHEDLGSWRWQGLGAAWAQGGGQAKPEAVFQCVVQRNGAPNTGRHGQVSYLSPAADGLGGSVSLRLGAAVGTRLLDRHFLVDFSNASGADALVAVLDQCLATEESEWTWSLCFERRLECTLDADHRGFTLRDSDGGATCRATVLAPARVALALHEGPGTRRTFSSGDEREYAGARYLTATTHGVRSEFFIVFTLQRGTPPPVRLLADEVETIAEVGQARVHLQRGRWFQGPLRLTARTAP